jgi:hypothetical protein
VKQLQEIIAGVLDRNPGVRMASPVDRSALAAELTKAVNEAQPRKPNPEKPERTLGELFHACNVYTDREACEAAEISVSGPAVELGAGRFLAFDQLPGGETRPVLGYDLPDSGRSYYHPLPPDTKVWAMDGAVVIGQDDLRLTKYGLGEPERGRNEEPTSPVKSEGGPSPDIDRPWLFTAYGPDDGAGRPEEEEIVDLARFASPEDAFEYLRVELAEFYNDNPKKALKMELELEKHGEVFYKDGRFTLENVEAEEKERKANPEDCDGDDE